MQQETTVIKNKMSVLAPKNENQDLRRAYSEMSRKMENLIMVSGSNPCGGSEQVETVRCACCGVAEDCTAAYIRGVRASFCGDWLCGLCGEAVREIARRDPGGGGVAAALRSHEAECRDFNATTRLNPTLSLAGTMRRIARRSFDRRSASCQERGGLGAAASKAAALARSASCDPRFLADVMAGHAGDRCR